MNRKNRYPRGELPPCPKCGMFSGKRMVSDDRAIEHYFVVCETCGYHTKGHPTQAAASREWRDKGNA